MQYNVIGKLSLGFALVSSVSTVSSPWVSGEIWAFIFSVLDYPFEGLCRISCGNNTCLF